MFVILYAILAIVYGIFTIMIKSMKDNKCVVVTQKVLSYAMFFNFPLIYFMLISFDLTTSAVLTTRNSSGELDNS